MKILQHIAQTNGSKTPITTARADGSRPLFATAVKKMAASKNGRTATRMMVAHQTTHSGLLL